MTSDAASATDVPAELCGYPVDSALSSTGNCFLVIGPGGRGVVLKRMDDDCLLRCDLHPSIRERLARVRELAHGGVANLYGVARDGTEKDGSTAGRAWLIWEYVEGRPFGEYAADSDRSLRDLACAGRELALAVDLLHMQGIVHGAIGSGNVIVSAAGAVKLTDVSPLLYSDPAADGEAVLLLLESSVAGRGDAGSPLGRLLAQARAENLALRPLAARLAALVESREPDELAPSGEAQDTHRPRRLALYGAALVALLGIAVAVVAWQSAASPALRAKVQQWLQSQR